MPDMSRTAAGAVPAILEDEDTRKDFFVERNGKRYAGTHLIVDLRGAQKLDDVAFIERALIDAVEAANATLLHIHLHHFTPNGGVSGVAVLAESHISIHTWPETGYAALDIFMCGHADPHKAVPVLERAFAPASTAVQELCRGEVEETE
jgi:S-adenosylmethionine decarboxylase